MEAARSRVQTFKATKEITVTDKSTSKKTPKNTRQLAASKREKNRLKAQRYRAKKKRNQTEEQALLEREKWRYSKQKTRKNQSSAKKSAEYSANHEFKSEIWLKIPGNQEKQREYNRRSR